MLKLGSPEDEDIIFETVMRFYEEANLSYGAVSEPKARSLIQHCVNPLEVSSTLICWKADNEIKGLIAGQITETLLNFDKVATELVWWVHPDYRKGDIGPSLLKAFNYWAEWSGCKYVQMVGLQNDYSKFLDRYYKREGFHIAETTYVKEI